MKRALLVFVGEAFRTGGQNTKIRGRADSVDGQRAASESHMALVEYLKKTNDIDCDILINSYDTPYNKELLEWYGTTISSTFHPDVIGWNKLIEDTRQKIVAGSTDDYAFIHIFRIDICLKPAFYNCFVLSDKLRFSFICWLQGCKLPNGKHRIADMMLYIPKRLFHKVLAELDLSHLSYDFYTTNNRLCESDIEFYIKTNHDSDSAKDYNPLYYVVNRPQVTPK